MWPILTDQVVWSVSLSVCHSREPCKNGWTDLDAVWVVRSGGLNEPQIRWGLDHPCEGATFREKNMPGHARRHFAMSCANMVEPIKMPFGFWTWVGPRKHVLHVGGRWHSLENIIEPSGCSGDATFLSNYFDHLFRFKTHWMLFLLI